MKYVFGIDGGGTKTKCYIANEKGEIIGEGLGGPANYQLCGAKQAKISIEYALQTALKEAKLTIKDMSYGIFGLSGADEVLDFEVLEPLCQSISEEVPHQVMNDTWIGLASGSLEGVVSICGTGASHAGCNSKGEQYILRNMDYVLGNRGGGNEIAEAGIHFAFRSDEGTYKYSILQELVPKAFGVNTIDEVYQIIRKDDISDEVAYKIPILVFDSANNGDEVSQEIIGEMGFTEGLYAASVAKRLGYTTEELSFVLVGSLFGTENQFLLNAYLKAVQQTIPKAKIIVPRKEPVWGAVRLALDAFMKSLT